MTADAAVATWRLWMRRTHSAAGGVTPREQDGFAETEAGGVLTVDPSGAVVLVGEDGRRRVLADDVPSALAVIAACGNVQLEDVLDGAPPGEPEEGLVAWLGSTFGVEVPRCAVVPSRPRGSRT